MMRFLFILLFYFCSGIPAYSEDNPFPQWFTPELAKLKTMEEFIRIQKKSSENVFYHIQKIEIKEIMYNVGSNVFEGNIVFTSKECSKKTFVVMWFADACDDQECPLMVIGETLCEDKESD
ncbi:MAG: hypothetical protein DRQ88_00085 [Epsilonproteobacteria bacterium]|nr:MAG: hypothetical protein DRQ89_10670 [Campylobacterota bacterium]RLA68035.1 MAG: hypothetical protein DRQ88_00085 [Campylobacterota bacterium]